ncbi:MAG: tetratricopeptide repeat protein [Cyanobacteria bacterium SIG28]|nr:tetratricopeptide repeat protein [Cyanobacteria bacterium SIG28]
MKNLVDNETKKVSKKNKMFDQIERCRLDLQKDPSNPSLHVRLGDLYLKWHLDIYNACQYIDEAITEYQLAMESLIDSYEIYYKIGVAFYHKGDLDKALNYLTISLEKKHDNYNAYYMIAETFIKKAHFTDAIDASIAAIQCAPLKSSSAHYLLYKLYEAASFKNWQTKFKAFSERVLAAILLPFDGNAIKNVLRTISYLSFMPMFLKGFYFIQIKNFSKAIELYKNAIEKAPGFAPLYCVLGDLYLSTGYFEDAITEYKMAIWLDSFNIAAYRHLCRAYEEQGDYNQAIEVYNKLIAMAPNLPDLYSNLANIYYIKGEFDLAIANYQTAITLNPNRSWTSVIAQTMGFVYQENKSDPDAAISAYQTAYVLTPEDIDIYVNLGSAFYDKEDYQNALTVYRQALELQPHNPKIHCNLGFLYWGKSDTEEAIKSYELAIKYNKNYDIAYNNLGVIYLDDLGRVNKALELFKKAVEVNPSYALAHFNLARATSIVGDKVEAAKLYQMAQDINKVTQEIDPRDIADKISELFES